MSEYIDIKRETIVDALHVDLPTLYPTGWLFAKIQHDQPSALPWMDAPMALSLDQEFLRGHSATKHPSPLIAHMIADEEDPGDLDNGILVRLVKARFAEKWNRVYNALFADYDPISNYDMIEEENVGTDMKTHTYEGSGAENKTETSVYGFNSDSPVKVGEGATKSALQTEGAFDDNHRKLTRSGNIGVTTSQQMIESELELRKHQMMTIVMDDLASLLCSLAY